MIRSRKALKHVFAFVLFAFICSFTAITSLAMGKLEQKDQTSTSVLVAWEEPFNCDGYYIGWGETTQDAAKMVEAKKFTKPAGYSSHNITGLKPGTKYYVCISYKVKFSDYAEKLVQDAVIYTLPEKVTGLKTTYLNYYLKDTTVSWKQQTGVAGYEYMLKNASGKIVEKGSVSSPTETKVKLDVTNNQFYSVSVRAFTEITGKKAYGAWSSPLYLGSQPVVKSIKATSNGIKMSWNKISGATNYTVYVSTSPKKGYKKAVTTKTNSCTIKKVNGKYVGKTGTYYVYVIANKGKTAGAKVFYTKVKGTKNSQFDF